ncbi:ig-like domain-containing protein [Caerostris darwini]|uniref:Ig-like domain-containing protein n=1 Tax=Caerostris darwini TaxID=1538125 RepID=A0AAV4U8V7_9ARAC|nr:ig-like domain-containing protein [Caerostris darwini]
MLVTEPYGQVPPRITHTASRILVQSGDTAQLPCAGQAFPLPTYRWYRKETGLSVSPVRLGHRREMVGGTLILRNAEIRDSGRYICVLTSSGNEDRAETELVVTGNTDKWFCIWLSLFWVLQNDEWGFLLVLSDSPYL